RAQPADGTDERHVGGQGRDRDLRARRRVRRPRGLDLHPRHQRGAAGGLPAQQLRLPRHRGRARGPPEPAVDHPLGRALRRVARRQRWPAGEHRAVDHGGPDPGRAVRDPAPRLPAHPLQLPRGRVAMSPVQTLFSLGIALMVPMLFAALGELIIEKAGVLNVGIEGVMLIGAFSAAVGVNYGNGSIWIGLLIAIGSGIVCGIILALLYVRLGTDQIVTGIMFNILAFGLTTTLAVKYVHASQSSQFPDWDIPGLH